MRKILAGVVLAATVSACGVSTQQEVEMGASYAQQINAQLPIVQDAEINRYMNLLGDSVAKLADDRNLDWSFYVVDAPEVNAFAVPGGFIYVNRGLIERTQTMAQLAGVLGHEIGHVTRRHSVQQMEKAQTANIGVTLACVLTSVCNNDAAAAAIQIGGAAVFAKFSRDDESQADDEAIKNVVRAGINPGGIPDMFQILLNERNSSDGGGVSSWFATHPLEENRIAATQAKIAQINPAILATLTEDSPNYPAFKRRVQSLPPSPRPRSTGR
ncbi:MAG TPA: M48 family metallopeptidase [Gemmatimonadaceae bacterium]|nr:M48 family metallopeptidase [Gemmatimonadaceae bacterium]